MLPLELQGGLVVIENSVFSLSLWCFLFTLDVMAVS